MSEKSNVFVMKDRVEGLEKLVDQVLKVDGLHDLAKDIAASVITKAVSDSKSELANIIVEAKNSILSEKLSIKTEQDHRFDLAKTELQNALVEHVEALEARVAASESKTKIAITIVIASMILSAVSCFL